MRIIDTDNEEMSRSECEYRPDGYLTLTDLPSAWDLTHNQGNSTKEFYRPSAV